MKAGQIMQSLTIQEQTFQRLRRMIIKTELKPGQKISESSLMTILEVGRTPIRESLKQLKKQNLVFTIPQSGTYVSKIDMVQAINARFVRESIEGEVMVEVAAKLTDESEGVLENILEEQKRAFTKKDMTLYYDLDHAFHSTCYKIVGKEQVWTWINQINTHLDRFRWLHLQKKTFDFNTIAKEHEELLKAIRTGNTEEARYLTLSHIHFVLQDQDNIMEEYADFFTEESLQMMGNS